MLIKRTNWKSDLVGQAGAPHGGSSQQLRAIRTWLSRLAGVLHNPGDEKGTQQCFKQSGRPYLLIASSALALTAFQTR